MQTDVVGNLLTYAVSAPQGISNVRTGSQTSDTPTTYSEGMIIRRSNDIAIVLYDSTSNKVYTNRKPSATDWVGWSAFIQDADWVDLSLKNGAIPALNNYGGRTKLGYQKIGNTINVSGGIGFTNYSGSTIIASLPVECRPQSNHYWFAAVTGSRIARCICSPNGSISVEWIKNISDGSGVAGAITWIDISNSFVV